MTVTNCFRRQTTGALLACLLAKAATASCQLPAGVTPLAHDLLMLARCERSQQQDEQALKHLRQALAMDEAIAGGELTVLDEDLGDLGDYYRDHFAFAEARAAYQRRADIFSNAYGGDFPAVAERLEPLADLEAQTGRYGPARQTYERILTETRREMGDHAPATCLILGKLAALDSAEGHFAEADARYRQVEQDQAAMLNQSPLNRAATYSAHAESRQRAGDFAGASHYYDLAARQLAAAPAPANLSLAILSRQLGDLELAQQHVDAAISAYRHALELLQGIRPTPHQAMVLPLAGLARASQQQGHVLQALDQIHEAQSHSQKASGAQSADLARLLLQEAAITSNPELASHLRQQGAAMLHLTLGPDHPEVRRLDGENKPGVLAQENAPNPRNPLRTV